MVLLANLIFMKVILYMAISLNGIIARENNEEDFLSHTNWETFVELGNKSGCFIWGKKTHLVVRDWEKEFHDDIKSFTKLVVSSDPKFDPGEGYLKASSPNAAINTLEKLGFKEIILTGGSKLNSSFAKQGLIDEVIFNVEPVILGKGIPVFSPETFDLKLKLLGSKKLKNNLLQLQYEVIYKI